MRKSVVGAAITCGLGVLSAGGYVWALHEGRADLQAATERMNASVQPGGSFSYATSAIHPFSLGADLTGVVLRLPDGGLYTAEHVRLSGAGRGRLSSLHADNLHGVGGPNTAQVTAVTLDGKNVAVPGPSPGTAMDPTAATFDDLTLRGVAIAADGRTATMTSIRVIDYGLGRSSTFELSDFSLPLVGVAYADRMAIAALTSKGIDIASTIRAIRNGTPSGHPASTPVTLEIDDFYLAQGTRRPFAIGRMTASGTAGLVDPTTRTTLDMMDVVYALPGQADQQSLRNLIGEDTLEGSLHLGISFTQAGGVLDISPVTARADGIGTLGFAVKLTGIDADLLKAGKMDAARLMTLGFEIQLSSASAFFEDKGLMKRAAEVQAQRLNVPQGEVLTRLANAVEQNPVLGVLPGGDGMRTAISDFLLHGGRIQVAITPPSPVNAVALAGMEGSNPATVVSTLGLTVTRAEGGATQDDR